MQQDNQNPRLSGYRKSFQAGRTWFLVLVAAILFYFFMLRLPALGAFLKKVFNASKPVIYGFIIAYILNPFMRRVDHAVRPLFKKMSPEKAHKTSRSIAIASSLALLILIGVLLSKMVIPNVYKSMENLVQTMPERIDAVKSAFKDFQADHPHRSDKTQELLVTVMAKTNQWIDTNVVGKLDIFLGRITQEIYTTISELFRLIVGLIVSIYVLFDKEKILDGTKRILYALFRPSRANEILVILRKSHTIFGGFIIGKLIDSLIIGVLCYIGLLILHMPYAILVATLVGTTNIIPFFGPYMGAIPSFLLIATISPAKGVTFLIFVLVLQQLDGNIIGPKILGESTGLNAFWVIFSIMLGGGLFGIPGMILAVPTFGVILYLFNTKITALLKKKHLPSAGGAFQRGCYVDDSGNYVAAPTDKPV